MGLEMTLLPVVVISAAPREQGDGDEAAAAGRLEKEELVGDAADGDADGDGDGEDSCRVLTDDGAESPPLAARLSGETAAAPAPTETRAMKRQGLSYLCNT